VHGWNVLRTARALGITRGVLYRKIEKYGLAPPE
jgi:transcriptional regulator of acetoin/glycerol metabolism